MKPYNVFEFRDCNTCKQRTPYSGFADDKARASGKRPSCKACNSKKQSVHYQKDPSKIFRSSKAWRARNIEHYRETGKEWAVNNPEKAKLLKIRGRSIRNGIPFDLEPDDLMFPEFCPVLGIRLSKKPGEFDTLDNSPSIDKIIPSLGYTKGNVRIISMRANRLKQDSTIEELKAMIHYMKSSTVEP